MKRGTYRYGVRKSMNLEELELFVPAKNRQAYFKKQICFNEVIAIYLSFERLVSTQKGGKQQSHQESLPKNGKRMSRSFFSNKLEDKLIILSVFVSACPMLLK